MALALGSPDETIETRRDEVSGKAFLAADILAHSFFRRDKTRQDETRRDKTRQDEISEKLPLA